MQKIFDELIPLKFVEKLWEQIPGRQNKIKSGTNVSMYTADYTNSLLPSKTVRIIGVTL